MKILVVGGHPSAISAKSYNKGQAVLSSIGYTRESVDYLQKQLLKRQYHKLSALELKHNFSPKSPPTSNTCPHSCIYLLIDKDEKELLRIDGVAKGYTGEGPRGAITIDTYLDLINIPIKRVILVNEMITRWTGAKTIETPDPVYPKFNLNNLTRIKRRAKDIGIKLSPPAGFDKLYEGMPLEEMLKVTDFYHHDRWGQK